VPWMFTQNIYLSEENINWIKAKAILATGRRGPYDCETSSSHILYTAGSQIAVNLPALRTTRPLPPRRFLVFFYVRRRIDPRTILRAEALGHPKNKITESEALIIASLIPFQAMEPCTSTNPVQFVLSFI
jgi:hypothetical protein